MPDGYIGTKADAGWWMEQVHDGLDFRKRYAHEEKWAQWRQYYRGEWAPGILPKNVFFSMLRSIVPRVYFRSPAVSVTPALPGFLNMAFAQIMNRIDNKMIRQMDFKNQSKDMVHDVFIRGTAFGKLGYGALFSPTPDSTLEVSAPTGANRERFEYNPSVAPNMPWFQRTGNVIVPDGLRRIEDARWVADWIRRPKDDVIRDPRFPKAKSAIGSTTMGGSEGEVVGDDPSVKKSVEMIDLVEVRDAKYKQVILIAPHASQSDRIIFQSDDAMQERRFPLFKLVFNPDDEVFWGVPDAQILEPYQLEANEIRTQQMKHRRSAIVKILIKKGLMTEAEISKMLSEDVAAVVEIEGNPNTDIAKFQMSTIPQDLIQSDSVVSQDIRDALGFSRNQMGDFQSRRGDTSATEAAIVQMGSEMRIDEKRDELADMLVAVIQEMHEIIFDHWGSEQIIDVVGPGGVPIWVKMDPRMLRHGKYNVKVDVDSSSGRTREQREAKALGVYNVLKENPFIDPQKLTRYLLTELEGVEFDDLLRQMPPPQGGGPNGPVDPGQFADILQQGVQGLPQGAAPGAGRQLGEG